MWHDVRVNCFIAHNINDFTVEMRKYIPAGSSEDPKVEPGMSIE